MIMRTRTKAELGRELLEQILALQASCENYDKGMHWEAKRIAAVLYVLLHDGGGPVTSLLTQIGVKKSFEYLSTAAKPGLEAPVSLVMIRVRPLEFIMYDPLCFEAASEPWPWQKNLAFDRWWSEAVFMSKSGKRLARRDLVNSMRSRDGGGHYDASLENDPVYAEMKDTIATYALQIAAQNMPDAQKFFKSEMPAMLNAHQAAIRQIAYEFLKSFGMHWGKVTGAPVP